MSKEFNEWFIDCGLDPNGSYNYYIISKIWDYQQAKIDALTMEYCPEEMTEDQLKEWKKSQKPVKEYNNV